MMRVKIRIPEVGVKAEAGPPERCGKCGRGSWVRWGKAKRRVRDVREVVEVEVERWRCRGCGGTVRVYPAGVGRGQQTERLRVVVALLWGLGLSLRGVVWALRTLGETIIGVTTAWRDVREVGEAMRQRKPAGRVRVLGVDGTGIRYGGQTRGMVVAVEVETGRAADQAFLDERDPEAVRRWLQPLVEAYGVEVLVSDDLGSYRKVAEDLRLVHQACVFHRMRWALRELRKLWKEVGPAWRPTVEAAMEVVRSRAPDGGKRLMELWQRMKLRLRRSGKKSPAERLRLLLARLSDRWQEWIPPKGRPTTNNRAEQSIGRLKFRVWTTRGLKTREGVETTFWLTQAIAGLAGGLP